MATLPPGARVGPYEVTGVVGAGGMGEVFRARDLTLHRDVALKVLLSAHAADGSRRARFAREARLLASLNHPHVAQIYGVEDSAAGPAIVMEYVEGRTLRDLLRNGGVQRASVPLLATQIASALDAAHDKGFVHRDLKPANIMVTRDGTVKLLDFGLAKAWIDDDIGPAANDAETAVTTIGEIVGTPAYMSPEQASGQRVDRRADIWAFGCVLFELLSGKPAFPGTTAQDTLAAVIGREPDWSALPPDAPPALRALVARCLEKDPRRRLRDIGDALPELSTTGGAALSSPAGSQTRSSARLPVLMVAAMLAGALATWGLMSLTARPAPTADRQALRFALPPPRGVTFGGALPNLEATTLEASPDGTRLAFIATAPGVRPQIWVRALAEDDAARVNGTEGAISMFWAPDGRSLGFFSDGQLRRVSLDGGAPIKICDVAVNVGLSGTWGADGDILFNSVSGEAIYRVAAAGGTPVPVITAGGNARRVGWPRFLPDGRRFLYSALDSGFRGHVMLVEPDGSATLLFDAVSHVRWVAPDWVLFVREGTLLAQRVDLSTKKPLGDPVSVAGRVAYSAATGWADFTASANGTLAFQTNRDESRLAWFDRTGREIAPVGQPGAYFTLTLSPDDRAVLFTRLRPELGTYDIWSMDLVRQSESPVTTSPGMETGEVWLANGREVLYAAAEGTAPNLHHRDLITGVERRLLSTPRFQFPTAVSPDGMRVVYQQRTEQGTWDVLSVSLSEPREPTPLFASAFSEHTLRMSPSGRQVAFVSDESGRSQIYVAPYPIAGAKPLMVTTAGGGRPRWGRRGDELYFMSSGRFMVAAIDASGHPGPARALFDVRGWLDFDVARDGRILANVTRVIARELPLSVVVNWTPPAR